LKDVIKAHILLICFLALLTFGEIMTAQHSPHMIVNREFLDSLDPAPQTPTYGGVDHKDVYDLAKEIGESAGYNFIDDRIELTKEGQRAFMTLHFESFLPGMQGYRYAIALRSTYDKSASLAAASGPAIAICSNLQIWGEDVNIFRKHTKYITNDLGDMFEKVYQSGKTRFEERIKALEEMKETDLTHRQGRLLIGCARGLGVLGGKTTKVAFDHWTESPFEEFNAERNLFGLHNALTWAAHTERPATKFNFHKKINEFIKIIDVQEDKLILS
jgi:hypothetical protein